MVSHIVGVALKNYSCACDALSCCRYEAVAPLHAPRSFRETNLRVTCERMVRRSLPFNRTRVPGNTEKPTVPVITVKNILHPGLIVTSEAYSDALARQLCLPDAESLRAF